GGPLERHVARRAAVCRESAGATDRARLTSRQRAQPRGGASRRSHRRVRCAEAEGGAALDPPAARRLTARRGAALGTMPSLAGVKKRMAGRVVIYGAGPSGTDRADTTRVRRQRRGGEVPGEKGPRNRTSDDTKMQQIKSIASTGTPETDPRTLAPDELELARL